MLTSEKIRVLGEASRFLLIGWTQETLARNARDIPTTPSSPDACCWCAVGAVCKALGEDNSNTLRVQQVVAELEYQCKLGVTGWNDSLHRHRGEVLAIFRFAIERLVRRESDAAA